jgi:crotonobetainyl-CoA:carnitine CoA-transferase CaiB-like acyl-CoA transferase
LINRKTDQPFGAVNVKETAMRPFEGIKVLDLTHVLAGPFATYQLALLGADVIKIEPPDDPDQTRSIGADKELNRINMGTFYLAQSSNKRSITLNIKAEQGRAILKRLAALADVMVENYRPGALKALGVGADEMMALNPRLIYASMSAYGQEGPRGIQTGYDMNIQASSGIMAMTGTETVAPLMLGPSAVDYASGTTGAFALASALFQRERTGKGQRIDLAMVDVAMILMGSHLSSYLRNGSLPKPRGNRHEMATNGGYQTKDGYLVLGASNLRQAKRLWMALGRPEFIKPTMQERRDNREPEAKALAEILMTRTAAEWEEFFQANHVPAARVRTLAEAVADPQTSTRNVVHRTESAPGIAGKFGVPVAAFKFVRGGGPQVDTPPPQMGQDTDAVLGGLGYSKTEIADLRAAGVI